MEEFLTPLEIAKILKVSPEWVYKHAKELGGVKFGRLIRFSKRIFNKTIKEVVSNGSVQASERLDVRLREERSEIPGRRVCDQEGSGGTRSKGKNNGAEDKYGLLEALHLAPGRFGGPKK